MNDYCHMIKQEENHSSSGSVWVQGSGPEPDPLGPHPRMPQEALEEPGQDWGRTVGGAVGSGGHTC